MNVRDDGKAKGDCEVTTGIDARRAFSHVKLWFLALRFGCESKGRRFVQTLVVAMAVLLVPTVALAAPAYQSGLAGIIQGPTTWYDYGSGVDDAYYGYFLYAYDKYDAAIYTLGLNPSDSSFTPDVKAKLSNQTTGGRFFAYAEKMHTFGANSEPKGWLSRDFYGQWVTLYGRDFLYWCEVTTQEQDDAKADLQTILNGGSLGGSTPSDTYPAGYYYKIPVVSNYAPFPSTYDVKYVYYSVDLYNDLHDYVSTNYGSYNLTQYVLFRSDLGNVGFYFPFSQNITIGAPISYSQTFNKELILNGHRGITVGDSKLWYRNSSNVSVAVWTNRNYTTPASVHPTYMCNAFSPSTYEKVYLDPNINNWPDTPTNPDPEPQPPTYDTPTPTPPQLPSVNIEIGGNFTADFQGLLDAMDEHCQHLQQAIYDGLADYYDAITAYMGDLYDGIMTWNSAVVDWLQEWFERMESDLDFSGVKALLLRIYGALLDLNGGELGTSTIERQLEDIKSKLDALILIGSVDTALDLVDLILDLINGLLDTIGGVVQGVTETFGELTEVFPFSIPWDIAAIAALFAAEPATPVFDIPFPAVAGGQGMLIHVDLHDFDEVAQVGRAGILVLFATGLALRTRDMMGIGSDDVA